MPARFEDYEIELLKATHNGDRRQHGYRKSSGSSSHYRQATTSEPTSTSTTRSSFSSTTASGSANATSTSSNRQRLARVMDNTNPFLHSARSNQSTTSDTRHNSSCHNTVIPTASIQEWAHQVHIQQRKRYHWCSGCFPKTEPLEVPTERAMRRVRIQEPTHCYE